MGVQKGINYDSYPEQGESLGCRVSVCYEYDTNRRHGGVIIRDDITEPFRTIFQLDNGRIILATECMYQFI